MKLCVLILRGLDASHLGPYGNRWVDTPALNALASQGVVFETHLAAHPDPDSTRRCWRTGRHQFPMPQPADAAPAADLLDALRGAGVATRLLLDESRPSPPAFAEGWDSVQRTDGLEATVAAGVALLRWLREQPRGLAWIELAPLLPPWEVEESFVESYFSEQPAPDEDDPTPEAEEEPIEPLFDPPAGPVDPEDDMLFEVLQTTYAAAVSQLDAALVELLDGLEDDVGLLVTSDHGQALAEHGVVGPVRPWLHREVVHVPLLLRAPGLRNRRAPGLTLSIDLAPTVADYFGMKLPDAHGASLLPLARSSAPWREYACLGASAGGTTEWGLWTAGWSLRLPLAEGEAPRLYVKPDDHGEVNDVAQHHPEEVEALARTLRAYVEAAARPGPLQVPPLEQAAEAAPPE